LFSMAGGDPCLLMRCQSPAPRSPCLASPADWIGQNAALTEPVARSDSGYRTAYVQDC
jgi:hypothetical protein